MVQQLPQTGPSVHEELLDILKANVEAEKEPKPKTEVEPFRRKIVWFNALGFLALHIAAVYGLYLGIFRAQIVTSFWDYKVLHNIINCQPQLYSRSDRTELLQTWRAQPWQWAPSWFGIVLVAGYAH
ncbi:hypothetical protein J6590_055454 [Homalodisca vitripennis]|nr:hypothetical protein J6590_055454 [Homalodisca vitripennis]